MPSPLATRRLLRGTNSALIMGRGTNSVPASTVVASKNFLDFRTQSTATSGDSRGMYLRHYLAGGSASSGDAARLFATVNANIDTASGAHVSLSFKAEAGASECSGLGVALRSTLHIPDIASWAPTGTYSAANFEIYSDGTASDPAGMTELSVLRLLNSGNATGKADVDTDAALISVQGFTAAAGVTNTLSSTSLAELPTNVGLRVNINGALYYIPCVAAAGWN
ncbi:MAG: hypothetical protein IT442_04915 [Phycisphaeraceae bacterium]|nr:hypothetical protein [Phycisphaeraceae bacterium]